MEAGDEYVFINNITKEWFDKAQLQYSSKAIRYVHTIVYAGLNIPQRGFSCFLGDPPAISIYRITKNNGESAYVRMKLIRARMDRNIKYYLEDTQDFLYENDFWSLKQGNSDDPKHPILGQDYNLSPVKSARKLIQLVSLPTVLKAVPKDQKMRGQPQDSLEHLMSEPSQYHSPEASAKDASRSVLSSGRCHSTSKILSSEVYPETTVQKAPIRKAYGLTQSSTLFYQNFKARTNQSRSSVIAAKHRKPRQNPPVTASFMLGCLALNTTLGKFSALALFLGCLGLVVSTYGSVFCASAALAITGAITCGISMFHKPRSNAGGNVYIQHVANQPEHDNFIM